MPPLIALRRQRAVLALVACGVVLVAVLGAVVWHGSTTRLDSWVWRELFMHVDGQQRFQALTFSDPMFTTSMLTVVVLAALAARRWNLAVLAVLGPVLALAVTEGVLKPLFRRHIEFAVPGTDRIAKVAGSYPSGHETAVAAAAVVLLVALAQLRPGRAMCWLIGVVVAVWPALAAVGLVRSYYHYATDIVGAVGVSTAVVLSTALALDAVTARRAQRRVSSPDVPDLPRTSRAA